MDGNIKKIILIRDVPFNQFNQHDYHRFGIEFLRKKEMTVEIWDISPWMRRKTINKTNFYATIHAKDLRTFQNKKEIYRAISLLDESCIINCFIEYSVRTFFLFKAISKFKIKYCVFNMSCLPIPRRDEKDALKQFVSLVGRVQSLRFSDILIHGLNKIILTYYFVFGIHPASMILLCGEKSISTIPYPINNSTDLVWAHSPDYDLYLQRIAERTRGSSTGGVFLDDYLPHHPDFSYLGIDYPVIASQYYPRLCTFFEKLERETPSRILIAAHPRSDYDSLPDYYAGRTIIKGETARLVDEASFVITHMSTSLNFAVLFQKPIFFITSDNLQKMRTGKNITGLFIETIAAELGKVPINIDHSSGLDFGCEMEINESAYKNYINNYIKKSGTPEIPLWEIFWRHIKGQKFQ